MARPDASHLHQRKSWYGCHHGPVDEPGVTEDPVHTVTSMYHEPTTFLKASMYKDYFRTMDICLIDKCNILRPPFVHCTVCCRSTKCGPNLSPLDLAEGNGRRLLNLSNNLGVTLGSVAGASAARVEPVHEATFIPPDRESENHTTSECISHTLEAAQSIELRSSTLRIAEWLVHRDIDGSVFDDHTVLHVFAHNGLEHTILCGKLGNDSEGLRCVDLKPDPVVVLVVAVQVWVVAATDLVTDPHCSRATLVTFTCEQALLSARMRCNLVRTAVGFPDIHLVAADTISGDISLVKISC
jgi:hypothetical protein